MFFLGIVLAAAASTSAADSNPQRIISMAPAITETLFVMGAGERVVGVTTFCQWPQEACSLPRVGGMLNPNLESWIALQPDLIILQKDSRKLIGHARRLGIPTLAVNMTRLENIFEAFKRIGQALGDPASARNLTDRIQAGMAAIRARRNGISDKRVLLLIADSSDPGRDLYAVGPSTFLGELLEAAGGRNLLTDPLAKYPRLSKEFLIRESPEIIIEAGPKARLDKQALARRMRQWKKFPTVTAVRQNRIHFIGADYVLIPGPRLLNIVERFARAIHPDLFKEGE